MSSRPIIYLLISTVFFCLAFFDLFRTNDSFLWLTWVFISVSYLFSLLSVINGVKFIKNKKRIGVLFVYDLAAIIGGTIILIILTFFTLFFIDLGIHGLPQD
jgi:hypothetical protein